MKYSAKNAFAEIQGSLLEEEVEEKFDADETMKEMVSLVKMWFEQYGKHKITNEKEHVYVLRELGLKLSTIKPAKADREKKKREMNLSKAERERRSKRMKEYWAVKKGLGDKAAAGEINAVIGNPIPDTTKKSTKKSPAKK